MPEPLADLRATILRRVDLLADDTRRILAAGSVVGRSFDLTLLGAMTDLEPAVLAAALSEAVAAEVVVDDGDGRYTFSHALVQDALYSGLGPTRRVRLHRRAAEAIESLRPDEIAAIAHHHCCALPVGDRDRAVDAARRAGADAAVRGAHEQAVEHFERALAVARSETGCCIDPPTEARLLCDLGDECIKAGATDRADEVYAAAVRIAREIDDPVLLAEAAIGLGGGIEESVGFQLGQVNDELIDALVDARATLPEHETAWCALVTARLAGARYDMNEVVQAQKLSAEALDLARLSGDPRALAMALAVRHNSLSCPDALRERLALDDELRALGAPPTAQAVMWRVNDLVECGWIRDADAEIDALETGPLARSQPRTRWFVAHYRSMRAGLDGRLRDAMALSQRAADIGTQLGARTAGVTGAVQQFFLARELAELDGYAEALDALAEQNPGQPGFVVGAAWARAESGRLDEARAQLERLAANGFAAVPRNGVWLTNMLLLADICDALGDATHAGAIYEELLPLRDRFVAVPRLASFQGSVERPLGALALLRGDLDAAEEHVARARAAHEAVGAPLLVARCDLIRARLLRARGERTAADALVAQVRAAAEREDWPDLALDAAGMQ